MPIPIPVVPISELAGTKFAEPADAAILGFAPQAWIGAYRSFGPVFHVAEMGRTFLCGPAANAAAWRRPDDWSYARSTVGEVFQSQLGEDYITGSDGAVHRRQRKLLRPVFTGEPLGRHLSMAATLLRDRFAELAQQDRRVDLHNELILLYTLAFNRTMVDSGATNDMIQNIALFEEAMVRGGGLAPAERAAWYARPNYVELREHVLDHFRQVVRDRLAGLRVGDNLDLLIETMPKETGQEPCFEELVRDAYLMQAGGAGNIATMFCHFVSALVQAPEWLNRIAQEIASLEIAAFAREGMKGFPFTRAVMLEGERRFAPTPIMPKVATHDLDFLGYHIPAGLEVLHVFSLVNFLEENYAEPMKFDPDRWMNDDRKKPAAFGGGEHMCLGIDVARLYLFLSLAMFLKEFTVVDPQGPKMVRVDTGEDRSPERLSYMVQITRRAESENQRA